MLQTFIAKRIATVIIKKVMEKRAIKKMQKYVEEPNELDMQMKQLQKTIVKQGKYIEELEKNVATLKKESHPPIFGKDDYKKLIKRLNKLEKRR